MKENTNKAIAVNTIILYVRLFAKALCGLLVSRFALLALGVDDFGVFAVVGGVINIIAIINTIMLSTSNRFIAVAIGKGDIEGINKQFNVNLIVHIAIAIFVMIIAIPVGDWYINNFVHYEGDLSVIIRVYHITIWGSVISFLSVPYNGLLMAKERFAVWCVTDVVVHVFEAIICYLLIYHFVDKLQVYAITKSIMAATPAFVYAIYCNRHFKELVRFKLVKDKSMYGAVMRFSVWVGYGALASVGKAQGSALIINTFFNTAMNTALGLANSVNSVLAILSGSVSSSLVPQITKSYAAGNKDRAVSLTCFSSRIAFMFMLLVSSPFLLTPDFFFKLWLGNVPDYVVIFTQLIIVDALIGSLNRGVPELVFATGNIRGYQLIVNSILLFSIVVAYYVLKLGMPAYSIIITYIIFTVIALVARQIVLNKITKINNWIFIKDSYIPSFIIMLLYIPFLLFHPNWNPILLNVISVIYILILCVLVGVKKNERELVLNYILSKVKKH